MKTNPSRQMKTRLRKILRPSTIGETQKGSVLLETVLVMPALLLLMLAMFELGRAVYIQTALNAATHQGVRVAAQRGGGAPDGKTQAGVAAFKQAVADDPILDPKKIHGTPKFTPAKCTRINSTIVGTTQYKLEFVFPGFNALAKLASKSSSGVTSGIVLTGKANLRCEVTWK